MMLRRCLPAHRRGWQGEPCSCALHYAALACPGCQVTKLPALRALQARLRVAGETCTRPHRFGRLSNPSCLTVRSTSQVLWSQSVFREDARAQSCLVSLYQPAMCL